MVAPPQKTLAIVGLGYVGLPLAVEFGKHRPVIGFDINGHRIAELSAGRDSTLEVTPEELGEARHLRFSSSLDDIRAATIFIVTVPTPVDAHKRPDLGPLLRASESVGKVLKAGDIVIYESTVYPGATEDDCVPVLEKVSGLRFNRDFFCGYSPERINPGDKSHRLPSIRKVTSGSTAEVADEVDALYASIVTAGTYKAESIKVAEAAKVFIAMKEAGSTPTGKELGPYLSARLFKAKDAEGSYNTWLQLLSDAELAALLPVRNTDFAQDPSGLPFDWSINRGRNVTTRFTRLPGKEGERALRIQFGVGRVRFGGVLQVTFMRPGTYLFSGRQSGSMTAKRGMKWQVRCFPSNTLAGESSQLFGSARGWQDFSFDFAIPAEPGCSAQIVRLVHDARSASEEYASGEIAFSGINVTPAAPPEAEDAATVH